MRAVWQSSDDAPDRASRRQGRHPRVPRAVRPGDHWRSVARTEAV